MEGGSSHSYRIYPCLARICLPLEGALRVSLTGCRSGGGAFLRLSFSLATGIPGGFPWPLSSSNGSVGITLHFLDLLLGVSSCLMVSHLYSSVFLVPSCSRGHQTPVSTSVLAHLYGTLLGIEEPPPCPNPVIQFQY